MNALSNFRIGMALAAVALGAPRLAEAQRYSDATGHLRVAFVKQPFLPNGKSPGPTTMADGGIQGMLTSAGATVRVDEVDLTADGGVAAVQASALADL